MAKFVLEKILAGAVLAAIVVAAPACAATVSVAGGGFPATRGENSGSDSFGDIRSYGAASDGATYWTLHGGGPGFGVYGSSADATAFETSLVIPGGGGLDLSSVIFALCPDAAHCGGWTPVHSSQGPDSLQLSFLAPAGARLAKGEDFYADVHIAGPAKGFDAGFGASSSAVPEPATWAMMAIGFAGLGFAAFRSRKSPRTISID